MARVICPFCLKQHDMSGACPETGDIVPANFVREYDQVKPLWLVNIGFKRHGKTTYLAALTLMLEKLSLVFEDVYAEAVDHTTMTAIRQMRTEARDGVIPDSTEVRPNYRPLLLSMYNLPESGSRCLVMYDVAGEQYADLDRAVVPALRHCNTTWFLVSLSDLHEDKEKEGKTLTELFQVYRNGMQQMRVDLRGRNLIVVYTKADIEPSTREVKEYLRRDPFQNLTLSNAGDQNQSQFSRADYIAEMTKMSTYLQDYTRTRVENGAAFINMVKAQGMNLQFCVTSALGQGAEGSSRRMLEDAKRFRVLDPFFWAIALDDQPKERSFYLAVDSTNPMAYQRSLELWEAVSQHGDVTTYLLGQMQPVAQRGQRPPEAAPRRDAVRLIGPILEQAPPDSRLVLLTGERVLDLMDFYNTSWRDRLTLVTFDENSSQEWPNTIIYRSADRPNMIVDALLRA